MRRFVEAEAAGTAVAIGGRIDGLEVLPFILGHARAGERRHIGVPADAPMNERGAAAVQSADEQQTPGGKRLLVGSTDHAEPPPATPCGIHGLGLRVLCSNRAGRLRRAARTGRDSLTRSRNPLSPTNTPTR